MQRGPGVNPSFAAPDGVQDDAGLISGPLPEPELEEFADEVQLCSVPMLMLTHLYSTLPAVRI